jgi:ABC-2 type transport system permease protein
MRIAALVLRILRQFIRDKRTLALMIIAPMVILSMMWLVFNGDDYQPKIAVFGLPAVAEESLKENGAVLVDISLSEAKRELEENSIDAIIEWNGTIPSVTLEGSDPSVSQSVMATLQKSLQSLVPLGKQPKPDITFLHGSEDMAMFDSLGPVFIGFFVFFFVFLIAGVSFLRERTRGTLERLMATPLRRWEIVVSYVLGFGLFTLLQSLLIAWYAIEVLDLMMVGSFGYVLLIIFLLAIVALTIGTFLSAYANNELQMIQFIPLVVVPQVFFSGLFRLETMHESLQWISVVMPLTYGADALRDVMIRGQGWESIASNVYVLIGFAGVFLTLNILALRKHRAI